MSTLSQRGQQKAATRARILEVARASFEERGYEDTNMRALAAEVGVAVGTVLLHFPDKRDLLNAALFDDLQATIERACATRSKGELAKDLLGLAKIFFAYYTRRPILSRVLLKEALLAEPPWAGRFAAQVGHVHVHVVRLVEEARARGEVAADADAARLGAAFFSFYYFALIAWVQGAHPRPLALVEALLGQHLAGVTPPARRSR